MTTEKILALQTWLKPDSVSCMLPRWVLALLPPIDDGRARVIKAAALVGVCQAERVNMGQVSYVQHEADIVAFSIFSPAVAQAFHDFGRECCMTSKASIIRTAIMMGLGLPRVELGVMSCTRTTPISGYEVLTMVEEAQFRFPHEPLPD